TTGTITFKIKAPEVTKNTTFLQYFNLHDDKGNWFGNHWQTGPGHRNMGVRVLVRPRDVPSVPLPVADEWKDGKSSLPWDVKFGKLEQLTEFTPAPPKGEPVIKLFTADRKSDAAAI